LELVVLVVLTSIVITKQTVVILQLALQLQSPLLVVVMAAQTLMVVQLHPEILAVLEAGVLAVAVAHAPAVLEIPQV
jgi:hypothetical protein